MQVFIGIGFTCCGGGPSPSSAMRLMYSWSILCPPAAEPGPPPPCCCQSPDRRALQSPVVCPTPPQAPHITLLVTLALSWHCHVLWSVAPQLVHLAIPSSRKVPFNKASSLSCIFLSSLLPSGTSTPCWITSLREALVVYTDDKSQVIKPNLILLTALFTESASGAVTYACKGSSSPGRG